MKCGTCGRYANGICLLMDCETTENKDACPEYIKGKRQTCGECKRKAWAKDGLCRSLPDDNPAIASCFEPKNKPTVFQRITSNEETLAGKLVYALYGMYGKTVIAYFSTIIPGKSWKVESEAIAATLARLKEVCDGN